MRHSLLRALRLVGEGLIKDIDGFLPSTLGDRRAGFECYDVDSKEMIDTYKHIQFGHEWKHALVLLWGGDFAEMQSAWMAATAYARATSGIIFDPQASQLFSASEALEIVKDNERFVPDS
jgi:hypothetical protein